MSIPQTPYGRSTLTADTARSVLIAGSPDAGISRIARLAALALRTPVAMLGADVGDRLVLVSQHGVSEPWSGAGHLPLNATLCREVLASADALAVQDVARHPLGLRLPRLENFRLAAYAGTPVLVDGDAVAVLSVTDAQPRDWSAEELALLADLASSVVRDVQLIGGTHGEQHARESRYHRLFDESGMPLFVISPDGILIEVNQAFEELAGRPRGELYRMRLAELVTDPDACDRLLAHVSEHGTAADVELELARTGGEPAVCVVSAAVQAAAGGVSYHGSMRDVTDERRREAALVHSALHDELTGLPSRGVFTDRLGRMLKHARRYPEYRFAVLFLDLDHFKSINDTHGHLFGDQLLISVARRLEGCVRQEDTVARIGGDEFALLLDTVHGPTGATFVADRILTALAEPFTSGGREATTSGSIGIALSTPACEESAEMLRDADAALYRAKDRGRNEYVIFDGDMHAHAAAQRQLEDDLRSAVMRDELAVHYHPVVELNGGAVTGLEALLRWSHPERGILLPAEFMPLAEQTGLIVDIGWWVLREACRQLRAWQRDYPDAAFRLTMSVNLSARQFVHPQLVGKVDEILEETGLAPECLRFDLTEAVVMNNAALAARLLTQLRERGIQICIDDFGTGYSSLPQLREFPISTLKIDRSFISALGTGGHEIVQTIIALGESMAVDAIAEGVETPEQLQQLRQLGARFAQGFLFSLPLDRDATASLLTPPIEHSMKTQ